jgi:poly(A) polymerase
VDVDFSPLQGETIEEDLGQRDFTVNSMALEMDALFSSESLQMIDPLKGLEDLDATRVRASSAGAFEADPVRLLRAVRIARALGFSLEQSTRRLVKDRSLLITKVKAERIRQEFFTILQLPGAATSLSLLDELELIRHLLPEVSTFHGFRVGEDEDYDLWDHSLGAVEGVEELKGKAVDYFSVHVPRVGSSFQASFERDVSGEGLIKLAALLHEAGKPVTGEERSGPRRFEGSDVHEARIAGKIGRRLKLGRTAQKALVEMVENHSGPRDLGGLKDVTKGDSYHFFESVKGAPIETLILSLADAMAATREGLSGKQFRTLWPVVLDLLSYYEDEYITISRRPLLNGIEIMDMFRIKEGPEVGEMLRRLKEARGEGYVCSRDDAIAFLRRTFNEAHS